jgi:cytochrome c oxidase accessory protein FixG
MSTSKKPAPSLERMTTIRKDGSRNFLRPADVRGMWTLLRRLSAVVLIAVYALLPWIKINGNPAVLMDMASRRFHFFGITLATEDLWLMFFLLTGTGFALFFVTAVLGRVWCGWACPQTVFLEHVYRRIERLFEGSVDKQKQLDKRAWDAEKVLRRGGKHLVFIVLSAAVAHIFLSYFISVETLFAWMLSSPLEHPQAFLFILIFTAILYFNFAWFREQLCLIICPYGRLQSALIDDDSVVIGYDELRGEPRGKSIDPNAGDCIDCYRCVDVCPTGIDIRQGLQMECIGCSNCIDACNDIMRKLGRDPGLVRYDSLRALAGGKRRFFRPRVFLYLFLMLLGLGAMAYSATKLQPVSVTVTRMTGTPFFVTDEAIRNQLQLRIINKRNEPIRLHISASPQNESEAVTLSTAGFAGTLTIEALAETRQPFILLVPRNEYRGHFPVTIRATAADGSFTVEREVNFIGPDPRLLVD